MSLLQFHSIVKEYRNKKVLDGVSLNVERKERVALIGNNGCGKSTLLKIAMALETPDLGQVIKARGIKIGYLSQNSDETLTGKQNALFYEKVYELEKKMRYLENQLDELAGDHESKEYHTLMDEYSKTLEYYESIDGYTIFNKIKKILLGIGLKQESLLIPLSKLSGGEKIRVALARILLEEPDLLILDEPTNHLDLKAIEWLEEYLKKFPGGTLIVSHDRYFLDRVATRIAELENGTIIEKSCNYTSFIEQKERLREYYLKEQKNLRIQIREKEALVRSLRQNNKIKQAKSRSHEVEKLKNQIQSNYTGLKMEEHLSKKNGPDLTFQSHGHISKDVAWAEKLSKSFDGNNLFHHVSFHIGGGERVAIIGANGCGKTTLLNILLGKDTEFGGIAKLGQWIKYCYLGQNVEFEDITLTILEEIMIKSGLDEKDARNHLAKFQFYGDVVNSKIDVLSGGEKIRLYLACIMLEHPHCLILDEPTNHLDLSSREAVERAIKDFRGTVISVSHDRYYLTHCINKIIEIDGGTAKVFNGNYNYYKQLKNKEKETDSFLKNNLKNKKQMTPSNKGKDNQTRIDERGNQLKIDISELESKICHVEDKITEMEKALNETSSHEQYQELGQLTLELDALYELYASYEE